MTRRGRPGGAGAQRQDGRDSTGQDEPDGGAKARAWDSVPVGHF
ncbi:hypothetical protein ABT187_16400 [Streptomyces sp. NPDC001817]